MKKVMVDMPTTSEIDPLEARQFGKTVRTHVKEFGVLFATIGFGAGALVLYKNGDPRYAIALSLVAVLFAIGAYKAPRVLHPLWKGWMAIAHVMGTIMTTVILTLAWVIVMVPLALLLKLVGKKVMDTRYAAPVDSYWEPREDKLHDFKLLERQF